MGMLINLYLDAMYEKARVDGQVLDEAVLMASALKLDCMRLMLGESVSPGE